MPVDGDNLIYMHKNVNVSKRKAEPRYLADENGPYVIQGLRYFHKIKNTLSILNYELACL